MVKAEDFWKLLCVKFDYRFFAGVACSGLDKLYKKMDPSIMHYIPAVNGTTALYLAAGVSFGGMKSAVLIEDRELLRIPEVYTGFNKSILKQIIFIVPGSMAKTANLEGFDYTFRFTKRSTEQSISRFMRKVSPDVSVAMMFLEEGFIK